MSLLDLFSFFFFIVFNFGMLLKWQQSTLIVSQIWGYLKYENITSAAPHHIVGNCCVFWVFLFFKQRIYSGIFFLKTFFHKMAKICHQKITLLNPCTQTKLPQQRIYCQPILAWFEGSLPSITHKSGVLYGFQHPSLLHGFLFGHPHNNFFCTNYSFEHCHYNLLWLSKLK